MTNQELKKLRRIDLLELLLALSRENDRLKQELEQAQSELADRKIVLEQAGSIAEAALQLSGVFQAAQDAAARYLESIQELRYRQEQACEQMDRESRETAARQTARTQEECRKMEDDTRKRCRELLAAAQQEARACLENAMHRPALSKDAQDDPQQRPDLRDRSLSAK